MDPLPYRIKIGVTGHRNNLPDKDLLLSKVSKVLGLNDWEKDKTAGSHSVFSLFDSNSLQLLRNAKNTRVSFSILTALAEGADRIVAESVLSTPDSLLQAVLPLTKEDYLDDFTSEGSKNEFERLLQLDPFPVLLRTKKISEEKTETDPGRKRREAYFNAGKYIVDNCDVLIAIWDGASADQRGGTSEVVKYAMEKQQPIIIINSLNPDEITLHPFNGLNAEAVKQIDYFNTYNINKDVEQLYVENIYKEYFDEKTFPESKILHAGSLERMKTVLFPYYAKASLIAKRNKKQYEWTGLLAYLFSVIGVMVVLTALVFHSFHQTAFIIEFVFLLTILVLISLAHSRRTHKNWLEDRFLVERIRVTPYFFISGQEITQLRTIPYRTGKNNPGRWMVMTFSEIWSRLIQFPGAIEKQPFKKELADYVKRSWLEGQLSFQKKYRDKNKWWNKFLERGGRLIFFAALVSVGIHIILVSFAPDNENLVFFEKILTVLALSLPPIAAAFEGVRRQREFSRNTKRSENIIEELESLKTRFDNADEGKFAYLLKETDKVMLQENQDWIMLMTASVLEYVT